MVFSQYTKSRDYGQEDDSNEAHEHFIHVLEAALEVLSPLFEAPPRFEVSCGNLSQLGTQLSEYQNETLANPYSSLQVEDIKEPGSERSTGDRLETEQLYTKNNVPIMIKATAPRGDL